jgi:HPt (histidine-containing phosphotransfer) domain-containing protein
MAGDRERCLGAGMDGYLIKPIRPATLLEAIERLQLRSREQPSPGRSPRVIIDRTELLDRVNGDPRLLGEITGMFQRECGSLMASVHEAMERRDASRFACDVHTLRGMFRSLSAVAAQEAAASLEDLDFESPEKLRASYALLEQEAQALASELLALSRETAVAPEAP